MACPQGNFIIQKVGLIVNGELRRLFEETSAEMTKNGHGQVEWDSWENKEAVKGMTAKGFLPPQQIDQSKVLDSGFFGHGINMTYYSDYALYSSNTRGSNQMLLCQILLGNVYRWKKRMDGKACVNGDDSHFSPKKNEIVIFNSRCILPKYIIEFERNPPNPQTGGINATTQLSSSCC